VMKKRGGSHEDTIREFRLNSQGVKIGPPLTDFRGIFRGTPEYGGGAKPLLNIGDEEDAPGGGR